ncbi:MAG: hypothetical protein ABI901_17920 [Roseiflexaceae bacterium]
MLNPSALLKHMLKICCLLERIGKQRALVNVQRDLPSVAQERVGELRVADDDRQASAENQRLNPIDRRCWFGERGINSAGSCGAE